MGFAQKRCLQRILVVFVSRHLPQVNVGYQPTHLILSKTPPLENYRTSRYNQGISSVDLYQPTFKTARRTIDN